MTSPAHEEFSLFLRLADSLHFARSAKAAHMSPSALTRFIQRLEEELGQPLFSRSRRGVALTRAGEIFRDMAATRCDSDLDVNPDWGICRERGTHGA